MAPLLAALLLSAPVEGVDRWVLLAESDASAPSGRVIDESVRASARYRLGLRFLTPEEAFVEGGIEAESGLSSCAADAACLAARLRGVRAEYALLIVARRVEDEDLIALRVVRASTGEVVHRGVAQARESFATAISTVTAAAFDALGYATGGELIVSTKPENAELSIAGARAGGTTLLAAGSHSVRARLAGFEDAVAEARVEAGGTTRAELILQPSPAAVDRAITASPWFWIGVGVAATALGVAVVAAVASPDQCFCAAADPGQCGSCP